MDDVEMMTMRQGCFRRRHIGFLAGLLALLGLISLVVAPAEAQPFGAEPIQVNQRIGLPGLESPMTPIQMAIIDNTQLRVIGKPGIRLFIKPPFTLTEPGRLVVDIANTRLGNVGLPFVPSEIGGVPVDSIRMAQFTPDTVRVVIQTPEPERFQVSVEQNEVIITALRSRTLLGKMVRSMLSAPTSHSEPKTAQEQPSAVSLTANKTTTPDTPLTPLHPPAIPSADHSLFPTLDNLRKLQTAQAQLFPDAGRRNRIIEIARSQLGLSKDSNPAYINRMFSRGQNQSWCADFISTVLEWSGGSPWGHLSRVQDIYEWGLSNGHLTDSPTPGNLVVFRYNEAGFDHIAFVESLNPDNTITTIGGNEGHSAAFTRIGGTVSRSNYRLDDRRILAFVDPLAPALISQSVFQPNERISAQPDH